MLAMCFEVMMSLVTSMAPVIFSERVNLPLGSLVCSHLQRMIPKHLCLAQTCLMMSEGHLHLEVLQEPQYKTPTIACAISLDTRSASFPVFPISVWNTIVPFFRQKLRDHQ